MNCPASKRRVEVRRLQLEESLEQAMVQLRAKKRECTDYRKRGCHVTAKGTGVLKSLPRAANDGNDMMRRKGADRGAAGRMGGRTNPGTRRAVLPASAKKGPNNSDLAALRRKITTLRARVGGGGAAAGFVKQRFLYVKRCCKLIFITNANHLKHYMTRSAL